MRYEEPNIEMILCDEDDIVRTSQPGLNEVNNNNGDSSGWNSF